jgi:uridine phosphorylase
MSEDKGRLIVTPRPLKGIRLRKVLFVPMDIRSRRFRGHLSELGYSQRKTPQGSLLHKGGLAVHLGCIGAPAAVLALEPLLLSGAKKILILGFCGSLVRRLSISDAVVITKARSDEGTSKHYVPGKKVFRPAKEFSRDVENRLSDRGLSYSRCSLVSTDAPYRETGEWLEKFQRLGAEGVDMEAAAVFALAEFYGIEAAALMIISDELWGGSWKSGFGKFLIEKRAEKYFIPFLTDRV